MPPLCLIFLLLYYRHNWRDSILRHLSVAWLFAFALALPLIGIIFSTHPYSSLLHAGMGINKAYILPFIAMECARSCQDLKRLVWAFAFACFWEGVDGIWQALTGADFIMGYAPNAGRLTGSLGDYTVGNYLALAMIPAFGLWPILRGVFARIPAFFVFFTIFWPACFLFQGASSRSGLLSIASALFIWLLCSRGFKNICTYLIPAAAVIIFIIFQPHRLGMASVVSDNRWDLWRLAWQVFLEHPWFGAGAGQYNAAFRELGLAPVKEVITISHPHNMYLDLLYAHGITGFVCALVFLGGFLIWGFRKIIPNLKKGENRLYWSLALWYLLGYVGWLVNGIFGHDFYRIWWLAMGMTALGIMAGAITAAEMSLKPENEDLDRIR